MEIDYLKALDTKVCGAAVEKAAEVLKTKVFDTIVFRGMSGALVAPMIAVRMDKKMTMIRARHRGCHSGAQAEGNNKARRYIIVDDFICSGETVRKCIRRMKQFAPKAKLAGIYLYENSIFVTPSDWEDGSF